MALVTLALFVAVVSLISPSNWYKGYFPFVPVFVRYHHRANHLTLACACTSIAVLARVEVKPLPIQWNITKQLRQCVLSLEERAKICLTACVARCWKRRIS